MMANIATVLIILLVGFGWIKQSYEEGLFPKISSVVSILIALFGAFYLSPRLGFLSDLGVGPANLLIFFVLAAILRIVLDFLLSWFGFIKFIPLVGTIYKALGAFVGALEFIIIALYLIQVIFLYEGEIASILYLQQLPVLEFIQSINPFSYVY